MKLKKLIKSLNLFEGKLEVRPNYPKINDDDFDMLINLDPTYNGGNELGKYSKWILNLYNKFIKDKLAYEKWEEQKKLGNDFTQPMRKSTDKQEDFKKIPSLLRQFNVLNKKLKTNIDKINSISELYKVVNDAKDKGLSDNSKVQKGIDLFKKSVEKGGKVVFKNNNWVILVPKTLESSVVFGDDTNWCTTAPNGEMYKYYKKEYGGKYFINLNVQTGDLYQFHFESNQIMDSDDSEVEFQDIINDDSVKKFYLNYLYSQLNISKKPHNLVYIIVKNYDNVPEYIQIMGIQYEMRITDFKNPTEKVQLMAIKDHPLDIKYIEKPSEKVKLAAVKQNSYALHYIKNPTEEMKLEAVKHNGNSIEYIKNPTEEMQLIAVNYDGYALQYIKNPSEKVQMAAIKQNGKSIVCIKNPTEEMKLEAVKQDVYAIEYIKNPSEELQLIAVRKDGDVFRHIKNPSEKVQLMAVKQNGYAIDYIDNPSEKVKEYAEKKKLFLKL